jgi:mitogen-activated protein kinase kinase kinase
MLQLWPQVLQISIVTSIKGANIPVDNKGCIKLCKLWCIQKPGYLKPKSMKRTPYWMAPEVIRQTGHNWQANNVACTVIEMATGKRAWSQQQFQEVAAVFHIGTTNSHPPMLWPHIPRPWHHS